MGDEMVKSRLLPGLFVALVLFYLYAPIIVIVFFSFTTSPRLSLPVEGLTLAWYARAFSDPLIPMALQNSAILALLSAVGGGVAGAAFAYGLVTLRNRRWRDALLSASMLPAIVPLLVIGIALAVFFRTIGLPQGLTGAAVGHVLVSLPFVILTMNSRLESFDFTILEAARDLGASRFQAFRDITLPLIRPSVVGAALLAAALSLDEFVITWFNIGSQQTVPTLVWGLMRRGIDPSVNAIATFLLVLLTCLVIGSNLLNKRNS
ncbi:MAG: ABC transporter permease [Hyphomicrobiales bacterium]|nr:MAG: ABC transporter permease [Hyphomicrobiales bacterium]